VKNLQWEIVGLGCKCKDFLTSNNEASIGEIEFKGRREEGERRERRGIYGI